MMNFVRVTALFTFIGLGIPGCGLLDITQSPPEVDIASYEVSSYFEPTVTEVLSGIEGRYKRSEVLFVFDIDNTLLRAPEGQFYGSDEWYNWRDKLKNDSKNENSDNASGKDEEDKCSKKNKPSLLDEQGLAFYVGHLVPTEGGGSRGESTDFVNMVGEKGYDAIALTARGYQFRYPTERELDENKMDFSKADTGGLPKGLPERYIVVGDSLITTKREVSYLHGIVMSAGQHKGAVLFDLLRRLKVEGRYKHIVFFDDNYEKNIVSMVEAAKLNNTSLSAFHYTAVPTGHSEEDVVSAVRISKQVSWLYKQFRRRGGCDI